MKKLSYILVAILSFSGILNALELQYVGETVEIPEGRVIDSTAGAPGVTMTDDNQTLINNGTIIGDLNAVSLSVGDNCFIFNNGNIFATSQRGIFVASTSDNATVVNTGSIVTSSPSQAAGIFINATTGQATNYGTITTNGLNGSGLLGFCPLLTNYGTIITQGDFSSGLFYFGTDSALLTNHGKVVTQGASSSGMGSLNSNGCTLVNTGSILTFQSNTPAFQCNGSNNTVINSGTAIALEGFSVQFLGTNPILTLLRGSNLQGGVSIADPLHMNVETGLNLALNVQGSTFASFGITAPFAVSGDPTLGVVDPTGIAMQADIVADLSDTILDGIYRHRPCQCAPCGCGVWIQGIGSFRKRGENNNHAVGYDNSQGGFLIGYDRPICRGYGGIFGGISFVHAEVDANTQQANPDSYFLGLTFEGCFCNTYFAAAVTGGYVDWENKRYVMNNLVSGGVETARFHKAGGFVSPEMTIARSFPFFFCSPLATFTARYAGLFLGSYKEHGSVTDLKVNHREVDLITTRFDVALPYKNTYGRCCWNLEPYIGVYGRYQVGGNSVSAELFDQSLSFTAGSPRNLVALLLGARGTQSIGCFNLFLNIEASWDNRESSRILGEGGIGYSF